MANSRLTCWILLLTTIALKSAFGQDGKESTEDLMQSHLDQYNTKSIELCNKATAASWDVVTDVGNKTKEKRKEEVVLEYAQFQKTWWTDHWQAANIDDFKNGSIRRQLFFLKQLGNSVLEKDELANLTNTITRMSSIYNKATVCPYKNPNCQENERLTLDPDISKRMAVSRDPEELQWLWTQWRDETGKLMRSDYRGYVELMNKVGTGNGYDDAGDYWKSDFEELEFEQIVDNLWLEVEPLYDQLHRYMRYKLIEIYGDEKIDRSDPYIEAHLLGNMWGQSWQNLYEQTKPFRNATPIDVTSKLIEKNYDELGLFKIADEFYKSIGLPSNEMSYTGQSIIRKPTDRIIQCHASAWDFCKGKDFRIKMCTNINEEDLITIHHEMGHINYYQNYAHLPLSLRRGANPGFHEAIGDTMALSVANPLHLYKIGLLDRYADTAEDNINALYSEALQRVAFLPFGLLIDKWRWDVFSGRVKESEWNAHWWKLRKTYQKLVPPQKMERDENNFDAGAKFHVPASSRYISYFISHILEFQFFKSLCTVAGEYNAEKADKPLHSCDFYRSREAGEKLAAGLKLGASEHWSVALEALTGDKKMSAAALLDYFKPLHDFLIVENKRLADEDKMRQTLQMYNVDASKMCNKLQLAEWDKITDINNEEKAKIYAATLAEHAKFIKDEYNKHFNGSMPDHFRDEKIQRQILYITNLGISALNESQLNNLTNAKTEMEKIYNNAEFCGYSSPNCTKEERLTLDPEINDIMATSNNSDELEYLWAMWHNATGPKMKPFYKKYIELSNEAAKLNKFSDYGEMWRSAYEDPKFVANLKKIWEQVEPLYLSLHEYTKFKLSEIYPNKINQSDTLIPAHLLGNMWGQSWVNLYSRIQPFKNTSDIDITASLKKNNFNALKIFQESDRFYSSLGLESNKMSYTPPSIIEKPQDRVIVCHASAWDFCDGKDFRIKQCTTVNHRNFITSHHEMGHIQYYIQYKDQPLPFRAGANPGFHEAVGDLMALSVSTPKHLQKVHLLNDYKDTPEDNINALFKMALERIAFLPFGLLIDLYRYDLFSGQISENNWNGHWEELREKYQKIRSPVPRTEEHFDAGAKFHVPSDYQYVAYFVAHILEFQFHKALCSAAGEYEPNNPAKPLHKCDIEGSMVAGERLRNGLSLGLSKHWSEALSIITGGERELSADAVLEYFKPLHQFLIDENRKNRGESINESKVSYVIGGFAILVVLVGLISYGIYYISKK